MEADNQPDVAMAAPEAEQAPAQENPTAKQMALAEEQNQLRERALMDQRERAAQPKEEEPNILGLAAQGMDVLHEAIRKHSNQPTHPDYVPPARTPRQMTALQEELEAGRQAQQRAQAQQDSRPPPTEDRVKEGFTTPVYRPDNLVPDPTIPATSGPHGLSAAGTRQFGPGK